MFDEIRQKTTDEYLTQKDADTRFRQTERRNRAMRFFDMQGVIGGNLAGQQQAVNNAENYPSTWTTNPDGGANGQV